MRVKNRAVFFKRDGVLNELIFNLSSGHYEAPLKEEDLKIFPGVIKSFKALLAEDMKIFILSHQPAYALGLVQKEALLTIEETFKRFFILNNASPTGIYYCHHHPNGKTKGYAGICSCRPPSTYFLEKAVETYKLNPELCWMVGDTDMEITMGNKMKMRTLLQKNRLSEKRRGKVAPEKTSNSVEESVRIILEENKKKGIPLQVPPLYNPRFPLVR